MTWPLRVCETSSSSMQLSPGNVFQRSDVAIENFTTKWNVWKHQHQVMQNPPPRCTLEGGALRSLARFSVAAAAAMHGPHGSMAANCHSENFAKLGAAELIWREAAQRQRLWLDNFN